MDTHGLLIVVLNSPTSTPAWKSSNGLQDLRDMAAETPNKDID